MAPRRTSGTVSPRQAGAMVKTAFTPPEEDEVSGILISDLSNPIWGELLRLLEDQEQAAVAQMTITVRNELSRGMTH